MDSLMGVVAGCLAHCWVLEQQGSFLCSWFPSGGAGVGGVWLLLVSRA